MSNLIPAQFNRHDVAAWLMLGIGLVAALIFHLLPALLAGLLVYELVHMLATRLRLWRLSHDTSKVLAVAVLSTIIVLLLTLAIVGIMTVLRREAGSLEALLKQLISIIDSARVSLPAWAVSSLPANVDELRNVSVRWLREHTQDLQQIGTVAGRAFVHILIGMIIGAMVALHEVRPRDSQKPLARALTERVDRLGNAFRRIVFAQVRISALNTTLTGIYLAVVLPLFHVHLPLTKTLIAITFLVGLLPVVGNLISNTIIVVVSLGHSPDVAAGSLAFLIVIHKLEYFVNAKIVGTQIRARAWEILIAMLSMEAVFGVAGVVAAPIFYAYIKDELSSRGLV
jgi:predicted PurR-regulated permease PerM